MESVACLRGGDPVALPVVRVIDERALRDLLTEEDEEDEQDRPSEAEQEAEFARWSRGLGLVGLSSPDYDLSDATDDTASEIAALYLHSTKEILVIDRGRPSNDRGAIALLAHESVHAMQDAELDLDAYQQRWGSSFDGQLGVRALIEGEAVLYELLTVVALEGHTPDELDWRGLFASWRGETLQEADQDESPLTTARWRFPYAFGGGYVAQHWLARGRVGIDLLFEQPPLSTSEVMFGTPQRDVLDAREGLRPQALPSLGEGYDAVGRVTAGAWIARIYAGRLGLGGGGLVPAEALLGDMLSVHVNEDTDRVVTAWRVRGKDAHAIHSWLPDVDASSTRAVLDPFFGWRPTDSGDAYLLIAEPESPADGEVVLFDQEDLTWTGPPETGDDDTDDAEAQDEDRGEAQAATRTISPTLARHAPGCGRFHRLPTLVP